MTYVTDDPLNDYFPGPAVLDYVLRDLNHSQVDYYPQISPANNLVGSKFDLCARRHRMDDGNGNADAAHRRVIVGAHMTGLPQFTPFGTGWGSPEAPNETPDYSATPYAAGPARVGCGLVCAGPDGTWDPYGSRVGIDVSVAGDGSGAVVSVTGMADVVGPVLDGTNFYLTCELGPARDHLRVGIWSTVPPNSTGTPNSDITIAPPDWVALGTPDLWQPASGSAPYHDVVVNGYDATNPLFGYLYPQCSASAGAQIFWWWGDSLPKYRDYGHMSAKQADFLRSQAQGLAAFRRAETHAAYHLVKYDQTIEDD